MHRKGKTVNGADEDGNECQIPHEILTPVKMSRCKRTYCAKGSDLEGDFDNNHFDKDHLDNERRMEETLEELRLLWEKANTLKKYGIHSNEYAKDGTSSARQTMEVEQEKETSKHSKDRVHLKSGKVSCKSHVADDSTFHKKAPFGDSNLKSAEETKDSGTNAEPKEHENEKIEEQPLHDKNDIDMDTTGELRMLWEKANKLRKCDSHSRKSVKDGQPTTVNTQKIRRAGWVPDLRETGDRYEENNEAVNKAERAGGQENKEGTVEDEADGDTFQDSLINNQEKLKETDEYKRAEKEEWVSRQQALQLQAEEVRKIRLALKRKKSESLRAKDMERRQKQQVEEERQTQKENEENMNMKEKLRAEVRMELEELEKKSVDMGSLLRALGVRVSGGLEPQPHEIRAAYRKALLSFHPDRAPASDIRGLVEAEEKFKLISRMKTLLPTS